LGNNDQENLIKELLSSNSLPSKEEEFVVSTLRDDLKFSWNKISKHCLHVISKEIGQDFIEKYFNDLFAKDQYRNRPFSYDED